MNYRLAPPALLAVLLFAVTVSAQEPDGQTAAPPPPSKATAKPPPVRLLARPLPGDRMAVTILYFNKSAGKLQRHTAVGSLDDVEKKVAALARDGKISPTVQDFVSVALARLRTRRAVSGAATTAPARQDELDTKDKKN